MAEFFFGFIVGMAIGFIPGWKFCKRHYKLKAQYEKEMEEMLEKI